MADIVFKRVAYSKFLCLGTNEAQCHVNVECVIRDGHIHFIFVAVERFPVSVNVGTVSSKQYLQGSVWD